MDELDELIDGLNVRGVREHELKEKLVHARERIVRSLKKAPTVVGKLVLDDEELAKIEKKETTKKVSKGARTVHYWTVISGWFITPTCSKPFLSFINFGKQQ